MPLSKYNKYFGGEAREAYSNMVAQYGHSKGASVFYATINKHKKKPRQTRVKVRRKR